MPTERRAAWNREYYQKNREKLDTYTRAYAKTPKGKDAFENQRLRWTYGITLEEKRQLYIKQEGRCANLGCRAIFPSVRSANIDHNHTTGKVRALLCRGCNTAYGFLKEDPNRIEGLLDYHKDHEETGEQKI